MVNANYRLTLR